MGILHGRGHHCQWWRSRAREESVVRSLRLCHGCLHLPRGGGLDLGLWLALRDFRRGLHGLCRFRRGAPHWWHQRIGRHRGFGPAQRSLGAPGGVRASQPAPGGARYLHLVVRLVWLQPRLHPPDAHQGGRRPGGRRRHELHPGSGHRWHLRVRAALCDDEEVRRRRPLQRHPGGPRIHHRGLCQRGVWQRHRHQFHRGIHLPGRFHAFGEAED
mmetsp:Transcript_54791/g.98699  ORF Transcript_54791/g.98699 Transcript_54791/m.98699 type:complete len:214 (-) Transcript_54791:509-1150(-)